MSIARFNILISLLVLPFLLWEKHSQLSDIFVFVLFVSSTSMLILIIFHAKHGMCHGYRGGRGRWPTGMVEAQWAQWERERDPELESKSFRVLFSLIRYFLCSNDYILLRIYGEDPTWLTRHPNDLTYKHLSLDSSHCSTWYLNTMCPSFYWLWALWSIWPSRVLIL